MRRPTAFAGAPGRPGVRAAGIGVLFLAAATLGACTDVDLNPLPTVGSAATDQAVAQPSLRNDIQPIFTARCAVAGCHITATEANLHLVLKDAETSYANLVNVESGEFQGVYRVIPGNSAQSWLMYRLTTNLVDERMPKGAEPLSQGTLDTIRNWIDQGALDN